jgi:integrase
MGSRRSELAGDDRRGDGGRPVGGRHTALPAWRANTATWSQFFITTPYDLRHLHATTLLERGAPLPFVSKRLGHRNSAITADVYSHLRASEDAKLGEMFGEAVGE